MMDKEEIIPKDGEAPKDSLPPIEETPKEIALKNMLDETNEQLLGLKADIKKLKVANEEFALKIGVPKTNVDDIFKFFSKYKNTKGE